jgi:hypothetical protein
VSNLVEYQGLSCGDVFSLFTEEEIIDLEDQTRDKIKDNVNGAKYICAKEGRNYLEVLYSSLQANKVKEPLKFAILINDLVLCKYIIERDNNLIYPGSIYKKLSFERQVILAQKLLDLEGIKYTYKFSKNKINYFIYYDEFLQNEPFSNSIYHAVQLNDELGVKYLLGKNAKKYSKEELTNSLKLSYYKGYFSISEILIKEGSTFSFKYLIRSNPLYTYPQYEKHLQNIKEHTPIKEYLKALSLVRSMFDIAPKFGIYGTTASIESMVHYDDNEIGEVSNKMPILYKEEHFTVINILNFIGISNINNEKTHLLFPLYGDLPYFSPGRLDAPYMDHHIYMPCFYPSFNAGLIHEMGHAFLYFIFQNEGKPYPSGDVVGSSYIYKEYITAKNKVVCNVIKEIDSKYNCTFNEALEDVLSKDETIMLRLNYWYLHKNEYQEKYKEEGLVIVNRLFATVVKSNPQEFTTQEKINLLVKIYETNNWSSDKALILDRMFDYASRDLDLQSTELLVRIPELFVRGISDENMQLFAPLMDYWQKFITPEVEKIIIRHFERCSVVLRNDENGGCILDLPYLPREKYSEHPLNNALRCKIIDKWIQTLDYKDKKGEFLFNELLWSLGKNGEKICVQKLLNEDISKINISAIFSLEQHEKLLPIAAKNGYKLYIQLLQNKGILEKITEESRNIAIKHACNEFSYCFSYWGKTFCTDTAIKKEVIEKEDYLEIANILTENTLSVSSCSIYYESS